MAVVMATAAISMIVVMMRMLAVRMVMRMTVAVIMVAARTMHMFVVMVVTVAAVRAVNMAMIVTMGMRGAEHECFAAARALRHGGREFQQFLHTVDGAHVISPKKPSKRATWDLYTS
jgi:hypothetical protein